VDFSSGIKVFVMVLLHRICSAVERKNLIEDFNNLVEEEVNVAIIIFY
jgi:hypothetical protein